jgi:hypothetical protein
MVDGGDSPVVGDVEGVADEVRRRTASLYAWSTEVVPRVGMLRSEMMASLCCARK